MSRLRGSDCEPQVVKDCRNLDALILCMQREHVVKARVSAG